MTSSVFFVAFRLVLPLRGINKYLFGSVIKNIIESYLQILNTHNCNYSFQNLSFEFIRKILLKFHKFLPRCSYSMIFLRELCEEK